MRYLRTNTAIRLTVGPFLDKTDGITPETGITVTSCKLTLMVDDANVPTLVLDVAPTASGGANDMVHVTGDDAGFYDLELAAANVNYLGRAMLAITDAATHCPVFHEFMILPAMIYDSLVLGTDRLDTNVTHVADTSQTARDIGASVLLSAGTGTGQLDFTSGVVKSNLTKAIGTTLTEGTPGNVAGAMSAVFDVNPATCGTWASVPRALPFVAGGLAGHTLLNTVAGYLDTEIAAILAAVDTEIASIISTLGTPAGASISADLVVIDDFVDALEARLTAARAGYLDNLSAGAAALEATAQTILTDTNEIQTGWAIAYDGIRGVVKANTIYVDGTTFALSTRAAVGLASANLDTQLSAIDDFLDTEVAAILAAVDTEIGTLQTSVSGLWTTALTEAYRADGAAPTPAQALCELLAHHGEVAISGTTKRTNKFDGSTQAAAYTLDSSSTPTTITRSA